MRLLCLSDIHSNLVAVRRMRAQEANKFDCIVVAGDIGNNGASEFFNILKTFKCPILYVYGNWDHKLSYKKSFVSNSHLIHLNVVRIGRLNFTGFSGCPTNWGNNPLAKIAKQNEHETVLDRNRKRLKEIIYRRQLDPKETVVITHERLTRLNEIQPNVALHLFGHIHKFTTTAFKGTTFVNVAALDRPVSARPSTLSKWGPKDCRNYNAGNYVIIERSTNNEIKTKCVEIEHDHSQWTPLAGIRYLGIDWIPEEKRWTRRKGPALPRYDIISDSSLMGSDTAFFRT